MKESMEANLKSATADEQSSVDGFATLKSSKESEVKVATQSIEEKQVRSGELAVTIVQGKDDQEDTEKEAADTEKFAAQLQEQCGTKEKEWAEREKLRNEEIAAISDAIGILNDDDALDVFKKAMPSALVQEKVGFLQRSGTQASRAQKAKAILSQLVPTTSHSSMIKLMLFSLNSKLRAGARQHSRGKA